MEPKALTLPCAWAKALSYLDDVEMYFRNVGIRRTMESLLNSSAAIVQAKETLKLSQPTPNIEALIAKLEAKIVNLKQDHAEATCLESFASVELVALVDHFHYVKSEYTYLWNRMNACYAILQDNEYATENKEHLIAKEEE